MARFILETYPFQSMGILVSKEVLEWNHLSESCRGTQRSLRSLVTCMRVICSQGSRKREKSSARGMLLTASPTLIILQHVGFSWGHAIPDLLETNLWGLASAKPQAAWSEGYHLCVILVASGLQFTCEFLAFSFVAKMVLFPIQAAFQARPHLPGHCSDGSWPVQRAISITLCIPGA